MTRLLGIFAALLILSTGWALAQTPPNLVGTWEGTFRALTTNGFTTGKFTLIIKSQDQELFSGDKVVERSDENSALVSAGGELVRNPQEGFIGVLSADGATFYLAENGDPGWYAGRVVDADAIEVTYVESGFAPVVHRTLLNRK